jgi:cytochrome c oxidase subunit 2
MMNFFFPPAASEHAGRIDTMIDAVHVLMLILFVGWILFFLSALFRFRKSRNPVADYVGVKTKTNTYLEVGVAIAEVILLVGFSIPMWAERVSDFPEGGDSVEVRVVAQQFAWNIWYPGADGVFGEQDLALNDEATNPIALVREGAGKDDIVTLNQLHLPVNTPARIHLSSKDVIHSFNLPNMRVKQDAIPGLVIPLWFEPTLTTAQVREQTGNPDYVYEIACAQLCGNSHYRMRGFLTVHTPEEYQAWLAEEAALLSEEGGDDFFN